MLRSHSHIPIIPLVFLGLALFATTVLVVNVIRSEYVPVQYPVAKELPLSSALNRVQKADAARWQGWADYYLAASAKPTLSCSQLVDAARWEGLANYYILKESTLSRAQLTDALRWTGLAIHHGSDPDHISPLMRFLLCQWLP